MNDVDPLVDKAVRLFNFLAKAQRLKERPIRDVENINAMAWSIG